MRLLLCLNILFIGAVIFAIPNMTRPGILFAVPVGAEFRATGKGRKSIAAFRALVAGVVFAGLCGMLVSPESAIGSVGLAETAAILLAGGLGFYWQNRKLTPFALERPAPQRQAQLSDVEDRLPWFTWLGSGPFAILAAGAIFLNLNWQRIPARFPVHWGVDGQPDRWSERSVHGVYGPLLFAVELCLWLLIMGVATWFGARRSRFRRITLGAMIASEYMLSLLFVTTSLNPLLHIPLWVIVVGPMLFIIPILVVMARGIAEPDEAEIEPTPEECWKAAVIYYNPNDAALFVEKRTGLGYTLNFGNRWSWVLMLGLALVLASARLLL